MCGRFVRKCSLDEIKDEFDIFEIQWAWEPSYNIAPGQNVAGIIDDKKTILTTFRWGLIPWWAKEESIGYKMINARAETLAEKRSFSKAFKTQRCLIVADGFYEWRKVNTKKFPMYIHLRSGKPFGFGGLYDTWRSPDGKTVISCTIITTEPNDVVQPLHNRMPVIIPREDRSLWLDRTVQEPDELMPLLKPYDSAEMEAYDVSMQVNSPKVNRPENIKRIPRPEDIEQGLFK